MPDAKKHCPGGGGGHQYASSVLFIVNRSPTHVRSAGPHTSPRTSRLVTVVALAATLDVARARRGRGFMQEVRAQSRSASAIGG